MSRPRRRSLIAAVATAGALAAPAVAQAATYSVAAGGGSCGGDDRSCGSLADGASAANPGDVFEVAPGQYASATFTDGGVTIVGSTAPPGVVVNGTLTFSGASGGVSNLQKLVVSRSTGVDPAVSVSGPSGLRVSDALLASANGNGMEIVAGTANEIVRSTVLTGGAEASAVRVFSGNDSSASKALLLESSIVSGGAAGVGVFTGEGGPTSSAGDVTLRARHLTAAGSTNAFVLDASEASPLVGGPVGNIAATAADSILLNGVVTRNYSGTAVVAPPNSATFTPTRTIVSGDPNALFVNPAGRNFRLKAGSPAIDKGGLTEGESATDVEGEPRVVGSASDQGADEFVNRAPTASIAASAASVRAGRGVTFSAAGSRDPEGAIASYVWRFGDGETATTAAPQVDHVYRNEGTVGATVVAVDVLGLASAPSAPATITVTDGTPPLISVDRPRRNQTVRIITRRTRTVTRAGTRRRVTTTRRNRIRFRGRALDRSGVRNVSIALRQVSRLPRKRTTRRRTSTAGASQVRNCRWLDPRRGIVSRSCSRPVQIAVRLDSKAGTWSYAVPSRRRLAAGTYRVSVAGTDNAGVFGNAFTPAAVTFKLR